MRSLLAFALASIVFLAGCDGSGPENLPLAELEAAPSSVMVDGVDLVPRTSPYRDFMPVQSHPDGSTLIVPVSVVTRNREPFPAGVTLDAVYVVYDGEVWSAPLEARDEGFADRSSALASGGPRWGPDVLVDVVVALGVRGERRLVREHSVTIGSTF